MPPVLTRYLDQAIFVSIPAVFEDTAALPHTLLGAEINGLWLQSDALTERLLGDDRHQLAKLNPAVFVPFAQIAGVIVATSMPEPPAADPPPSKTGSAKAGAPKPAADKPAAPARKPQKRAAPADRRREPKR